MITIGLTGGMAAGKSSVVEYLAGNNYKVFDSDLCVRKLLKDDVDIINKIKSAFGEDVVKTKDGRLVVSRKKLANIVFSDKEKINKLESIVHPTVKLEMEKFLEIEKMSNDNQAVFLDVPLLFEKGFDKICDVTINISTPYALKKERFIARGGTEKDFERRTEYQMDDEEKCKKADYIINNSGKLEETYGQIDKVLGQLGV